MKKKNNNSAKKIEKLTDLTKPELAYIAEDLLCEVLDRAAFNNKEYDATDEDIIKDLSRAQTVLKLIGWRNFVETISKITLDNICNYEKEITVIYYNCMRIMDSGRYESYCNLYLDDSFYLLNEKKSRKE
ncbi:MAG: hypothetical protein K5752_05355 [Succinivibrionaceae bacterium]|nr:hypothetical protein [Succinivibrionaceae bacterium]